ncbi:hypothetical protein [Pantoea dispersa]|uniref:hypothetical protein n=1 Tax=Pantoea dispersa TaxID=59814 RepID=UPI0013311C7D|nr:hypothetical protein [Pantoea dispersa]
MLRILMTRWMNKFACKFAKYILTTTILVTAFTTQAVDVQLTTEFKPDITQPQNNKFVNTTPNSGICVRLASICRQYNVYSVNIPGHFGYKMFNPKTSDHLKEGLGYKVDSRTKNIRLTDVKTNKTIEVSFRLTMLAIQFQKTVAGGQWFDVITYNQGTGGNCTQIRKYLTTPSSVDYIVNVPAAISNCWGRIHTNATWSGELGVSQLSFAYELNSPDPLNIPSGEYEGEVVYNVNNGIENNGIQFGTERNQHDVVRFKIKAAVEHAFFYRFPAGSETVMLTPKDGWSRWINGGEVPASLSKEVPFTLTTSQPFKMKILCQYFAGQSCALQKKGGTEQVPLELNATLPGLKTSSGAEVRDLTLNNSAEGVRLTNDGHYLVNRRSVLNFRVKRPGVEVMVKEPGSSWKGGVTLVFDTEI